jgi:hypothetical protein
MNHPKPRRVTRVLTAQQRANLQRDRRRIADELPDLAARDQMRKEASDEPTLSGELRRAIHSSSLSLADIAAQAGIPPLALDEFLTGERTLRSDVLDRLAGRLRLTLASRA